MSMTKAIRLHDYQAEIKLRLIEAWQTHRSVMLQMPTGTGKTHVLAAVVKEYLSGDTGTVWIIAHRRELVAQAEETIERYGISREDGRVKVMSIQWLARHVDKTYGSPSLVIIDEAHHAQAKTYRMLWEKCPHSKFLGLTATPCRMNRSGFTNLFDVLICSWSIVEFIESGWLSTFDYVSIRPDSREQQLIDGLEKRGADGDYQIKEMNEVLNKRPSIRRLYESLLKFANGKKGIVYAISIDHARRIAEYYNQRGLKTVSIDSSTPAAERKQFVQDFKDGRIQVLVNVDVFSEGFDCPDVEFVQMARPTLSLAKYLQQVGRGLRKSDGKDTCILIDNVGLYRVFGLPTVSWDWEAMFQGYVAGKGKHAVCQRDMSVPLPMPSEFPVQDDEMELVVSHDKLLSVLETQKSLLPVRYRNKPELKAWQDEKTKLWGIRIGRKNITDAIFLTVFDIRYDMAAVRLGNKNCGLVDSFGNIILEKGHCKSMNFSRNYFLTVQSSDSKYRYVDLHSLRTYIEKPEIKRYGDVEMLKVGHTYYSRTKVVYVNNQNINKDYISDHKFCITVFDYKAPASCFMQERSGCGYACILIDDYERYYWIYRWLADGSVIVTDDNGHFYHVEDRKGKTLIGCAQSTMDHEECLANIQRIAEYAKATQHAVEIVKAEKRQRHIQNNYGEAVPFRSGMKWGLKVSGRVTVPPIYRNIKSPVGKYCAVEKNYSQWGVISLDGTLMVEPQYSDIEISAHGIVTGIKVSGNKVSVKLP